MSNLRLAMISYHTCPLSSSEGRTTGGLETYVLELSKTLAKQGLTIDIYTRMQARDNQTIVQIAPGLRLMHLPAGPPGPVAKKQLWQYLSAFSDEILKFCRDQNLVYDLVHAHYYLSGLAALEVGNKFIHPLPLVMTFHTLGLLKNLVARDELEKEERIRIEEEKKLIGHARKIIAVSDLDGGYLISLYDTPREKLVIIPPGVDPELFRPIPQAEARRHIGIDGGKLILFVGRAEPLKGADLLLYALKILLVKKRDFRICLLLVGGDVSDPPQMWSRPLRGLEELRKTLGLTANVKFVGQKPQTELPYYYNAADVVVMPSHYESFGLVALESMACGVPVVLTDTTGISTLLDEKHGQLVTSVSNPFLLAYQIEKLLTQDADSNFELRQGLRNQVADLSWTEIGRRVSSVYEEVIARKY